VDGAVLEKRVKYVARCSLSDGSSGCGEEDRRFSVLTETTT
jgi:hypothetical protein